jgi:hypothetical protein
MIAAMNRTRRHAALPACIAVALVSGGLGGGSRVAQAGGEMEELGNAQQMKAWRARGLAALPAVRKALCAEDDTLSYSAKQVLIGWGAASVRPLIDMIVRSSGTRADEVRCLQQASDAMRETLCRAGSSLEDERASWVDDDPQLAARAKSRARAVFRPLLGVLANKTGPAVDAAVSSIGEALRAYDCPGRAHLVEMTAAATIALLAPAAFDRAPAEHKLNRLAVVGELGPGAAAAVPRAIALLKDPELAPDAISLLGAIGAASAPAVPTLRALLSGPHAGAAATALGEIGPPAHAALPDLIALLRASHPGCEKPLSAGLLAGPIERLATTRDPEGLSAGDALATSLRTCARYEVELINALGAMGANGAAAAPTLRAIMTDERRKLDRRELAAEALVRLGTPLGPDDRALVVALKYKSSAGDPPEEPVAQVQEPGPGSPAEQAQQQIARATRRAAHQINVCRSEVGRPASTRTKDPRLGTSDVERLDRLSDCLADRLCGPTARSYTAAMATCCRAGFGDKPPSWCAAD